MPKRLQGTYTAKPVSVLA